MPEDGWVLIMVSHCFKWHYLRYDPERPKNDPFTQHYFGWERDALKKATKWLSLKDAVRVLNDWVQLGGGPNSGGYLAIDHSTRLREMERRMEEHRNA